MRGDCTARAAILKKIVEDHRNGFGIFSLRTAPAVCFLVAKIEDLTNFHALCMRSL